MSDSERQYKYNGSSISMMPGGLQQETKIGFVNKLNSIIITVRNKNENWTS